MSTLATLLVVAAVGAVLLRLSGFLLGALAWGLLGVVVLSLIGSVPVPGGVLALIVVLWLGSQASSRVRRGEWRSYALRGISRAVGALRASA